MTRPPLGARVRLLENVGLSGVAGAHGSVIAHHEDGIASLVVLDYGARILCDPVDLETLPPVRVGAGR